MHWPPHCFQSLFLRVLSKSGFAPGSFHWCWQCLRQIQYLTLSLFWRLKLRDNQQTCVNCPLYFLLDITLGIIRRSCDIFLQAVYYIKYSQKWIPWHSLASWETKMSLCLGARERTVPQFNFLSVLRETCLHLLEYTSPFPGLTLQKGNTHSQSQGCLIPDH